MKVLTAIPTMYLSCLLTIGFCWDMSPPHVKLRRKYSETSCTHTAILIDDTLPQMIPLSNSPLLLLQSTFPIISRQECDLLSQYFRGGNESEQNKGKEKAEANLHRVQEKIDRLTNCPSHSHEMQTPRYARYDAKLTSMEKLISSDFVNDLLPDGLHVDTNNGKLFRHITAILYLTDNEEGLMNGNVDIGSMVFGAGTTFPLAIPFGFKDGTTACESNVSTNILSRGIHHTKATCDEGDDSDQRLLEQMSLDIFYRDISKHLSDDVQFLGSKNTTQFGIRVMPQAGKMIYFHNVAEDGRPEPTSFHGGEEIMVVDKQLTFDPTTDIHKSILVFFKEIPVEKIIDFGSFANEVQKARKWTIEKYYL